MSDHVPYTKIFNWGSSLGKRIIEWGKSSQKHIQPCYPDYMDNGMVRNNCRRVDVASNNARCMYISAHECLHTNSYDISRRKYCWRCFCSGVTCNRHPFMFNQNYCQSSLCLWFDQMKKKDSTQLSESESEFLYLSHKCKNLLVTAAKGW